MLVNSERRGSGSPLVLIHGIGHRWQAWEPVLDRLAEHHRVIAIDLPGFGGSPVPDGGMPASMPAVVGLMEKFFRAEGLDRPHVAGNSLGGAIALELAAADLVSSATALSPGGFFTDAERRRALGILSALRFNSFLPGPVMKAGLRLGAVKSLCYVPLLAQPRNLSAQRAYEDALALRKGKGFRPVVKAARAYAFAGAPTVPVCVGWGERDRIFRPHQLERARERLPGATHELLPACGHVPMSDAPDLVAGLILRTTGALST
ncbi:alpha/beta fold hydrolase [Allorhizocola rhizosphaerae]|uniref:alpha/beta fold hydrolase n=1 Tax=Allorhizocola rhizosphaerae TaxID=1872709 RepID=UPI001FE2DC8F|nr:alpha/beta fold hydrolase [Allorhizocola rhizosphaerae]